MLKDKTTEKIRDPLTKKGGKKRDRVGWVGTLSQTYPTKKKGRRDLNRQEAH